MIRRQWSSWVSGQELDDLALSLWIYRTYMLTFCLGCGVLTTAITVASVFEWLSPPVAGFSSFFCTLVGAAIVWPRFREVQRVAARCLGLEPRQARKLDISSAASLERSIEKMRRQGGGA